MSWLAERRERRDMLSRIPEAEGLPVLGQTLNFFFRPISSGIDMHLRHGPVVRGKALGISSLALSGPDALAFVLKNEGNVFSSGEGWTPFIGPFFTRGIMLLDGVEHRQHRGIMQAAFKRPAMEAYLEGMNEAVLKGIANWHPRQRFKLYPALKELTLDIATQVFMGEQLGPEADRINHAFVDCVRAGTALVRFPVPGGRWHRGLRARKELEQFFRQRIASKRDNLGPDLFSYLLSAKDENGVGFQDQDIVNHMIFLMMAAHDTSTIALSSMSYYLALHPEWQERLREEAQALAKETLSYDDLAALPLMQQVFFESLRLLSPVHVLPRRTLKACHFAGMDIPAKTYVIISPLVTHHLPQYWQSPERFDPERFSPERAEHKGHPYQYVPFGGGAHKCIGMHFAEMEVKTILYHLLRRYRWSVASGYRMPINFTSLPTPADGLPVCWQTLETSTMRSAV